MIQRVTYHNPDGSWGVVGVDDLSMILDPRIYAALVKLRDLEDMVDELAISYPIDPAWEAVFDRLLGGGDSIARALGMRTPEGWSAR